MGSTLQLPPQSIEDFCKRWRVSALSIDRSPTITPRELGVFVRFDPEASWNLHDKMDMQEEFQILSGRNVHLVNRQKERRTMMNVLYDA